MPCARKASNINSVLLVHLAEACAAVAVALDCSNVPVLENTHWRALITAPTSWRCSKDWARRRRPYGEGQKACAAAGAFAS
jgi:hypothetical protein